MKRKIWDSSAVPARANGGSYLAINPKSGGITFSSELSALLKFAAFGVLFIQDEDKPTDWYVEPSKDKAAFKPVQVKESGAYLVRNTALARVILAACGLEADCHKFIVATEPTGGAFAVITKSAKPSTRKAA